MTVNLRIGGQNWSDFGVVTASSAVATLPADRVQTEDIAEVWRAAINPAGLVVDLGATRTFGAVALIGSNAIANDTWQVRASITDPTATPGEVYDSGVIAMGGDLRYGRIAHFIEPAVSARYVRVDLDQASMPEAGRLVVCRTWTPSHHFSFGFEMLARDWSVRTYSLGLNAHTDLKPRHEGLRFALRAITETEVEDEIRELNRIMGTSIDLLVCRDITATSLPAKLYWGQMEQSIRTSHLMKLGAGSSVFQAEFEIWNRL